MRTIQKINISCVPTSTSNVSITGLVSLSWEAVAAACCRQGGLELRFFSCMLPAVLGPVSTSDMHSVGPSCYHIAFTTANRWACYDPEDIINLISCLCSLVLERKAAKYQITKEKKYFNKVSLKIHYSDTVRTLPCSIISWLGPLENTAHWHFGELK